MENDKDVVVKITLEFRLGERLFRCAVTPLEFSFLKNLPPDESLERLLKSRGQTAGAAAIVAASRAGRLRLGVLK